MNLAERALKAIMLGKTSVKELNLTEFWSGKGFCCITACKGSMCATCNGRVKCIDCRYVTCNDCRWKYENH